MQKIKIFHQKTDGKSWSTKKEITEYECLKDHRLAFVKYNTKGKVHTIINFCDDLSELKLKFTKALKVNNITNLIKEEKRIFEKGSFIKETNFVINNEYIIVPFLCTNERLKIEFR